MSRDLRDKIKNIKSDPNLNQNEKNLKIQELMMGKFTNLLESNLVSNINKSCNHYNKNCYKFYFDCCKIYDPCIRCHKERKSCNETLLLNKVKTISCVECDKEQECSEYCSNCFIKFAKNYCSICKLWTDDNITHCSSCNICLKGKKEELFHCEICQACFYVDDKLNHKCSKYSYKDQTCVICNEAIFFSNNTIQKFNCDHLIHSKCKEEFDKNNLYKCPRCKKSCLPNMELYWENIRTQIEFNPMPRDMFPLNPEDIVDSPYGKFKLINKKIYNQNIFWVGEFINWKLKSSKYTTAILLESCLNKVIMKDIYCNDCENKSATKYHFYGLECQVCYGFNTQL